jgi:sugar phosphate isomerase/epimerase
MELGSAAWGFRETPLERQLQIVSGLGLTLLELSIGGHGGDFLQPDATGSEVAEAKRLFARYGVRLECACTGNDFTGDDVAAQTERVEKVMAVAGRLGIRYLRIFAGFCSDSLIFGPRRERMLDALRRVAACARSFDILPVVETHGGLTTDGEGSFYFHSVSTRIDVWPAMLATGVFINYDPANLDAVGCVDPVAFYEKFSSQVRYVHLKDFHRSAVGLHPVACGEGGLDWERLMAALRNYTGPALIEYELPEDVEDGLRRSLNFLTRWSR